MESRNISLDILRIIACMAVIMIHTAGAPLWHHMVEEGTLWYDECLVLAAISRWAVPVFAMITGYFMLDSKKELPIKKLFSKYILRLVIALVFWSLFYALTLYGPIYPFGAQESHFWYVSMCIGLYLSMPILRLVAQHKNVLAFFCWTWLGLMLYQFMGNFETLPIVIDRSIFAEFVGYCMWAYYLKSIELQKPIRMIIYVLGVLGLVVSGIMGAVTENVDSFWVGYSAPNVIVTSIAMFVIGSHQEIHVRQPIQRVIMEISQCTFGIYMVHMWVLVQIFFRAHRYVQEPLMLCFACVIMAFAIGGGISWILKRIPIAGKYVV